DPLGAGRPRPDPPPGTAPRPRVRRPPAPRRLRPARGRPLPRGRRPRQLPPRPRSGHRPRRLGDGPHRGPPRGPRLDRRASRAHRHRPRRLPPPSRRPLGAGVRTPLRRAPLPPGRPGHPHPHGGVLPRRARPPRPGHRPDRAAHGPAGHGGPPPPHGGRARRRRPPRGHRRRPRPRLRGRGRGARGRGPRAPPGRRAGRGRAPTPPPLRRRPARLVARRRSRPRRRAHRPPRPLARQPPSPRHPAGVAAAGRDPDPRSHLVLTAADDHLHPPPVDDPWWTETAWFGFAVPAAGLCGSLYQIYRPNQGVMSTAVYVWEPGREDLRELPYYRTWWHLPIPEGAHPCDNDL